MRRRHALVRLAALAGAALAGLLLAPAPAGAVAIVTRYVALGDSYSSGLGAGSEIAGSGTCERSTRSYPALWAAAHNPASYTSLACAGATITDVTAGQLPSIPATTTLISLSVGGNDENFGPIMTACNIRGTTTCVNDIDAAEADISATLPAALTTLYAAIRAQAPGASVVVLGYPDFYDLGNNCVGLSQTSRAKIDEGIDLLDSVTAAAAANAGVAFADVRSAFTGHEICDSGQWLHAVDIFHLADSYHPTSTGQAKAYLPTFTSVASPAV